MSDLSGKIYKELICLAEGLPFFPQLLLLKSVEYLNPKEGVIKLPTLHELLTHDFYVERAPGRKRENITENSLRNAFRTIKKCRGDYFKFKVVNQRIEIDMPWMRELYQNFCNQNKDAAVKPAYENTSSSLENTEQTTVLTDKKIEQVRAEAASAKGSVKYINKYINNNNNNNQKLPITDDFNPNPETIARAEALGYSGASDFKEIQDFIDHNKATGSRFADFNPIYLRWLARRSEHKAKQQQTQENNSGRTYHAGSYSKPRSRQPSAVERVKQAYAKEFELNETTGQFIPKAFNAVTSHSNTLAATY